MSGLRVLTRPDEEVAHPQSTEHRSPRQRFKDWLLADTGEVDRVGPGHVDKAEPWRAAGMAGGFTKR